jgi:hypothetical protein
VKAAAVKAAAVKAEPGRVACRVSIVPGIDVADIQGFWM